MTGRAYSAYTVVIEYWCVTAVVSVAVFCVAVLFSCDSTVSVAVSLLYAKLRACDSAVCVAVSALGVQLTQCWAAGVMDLTSRRSVRYSANQENNTPMRSLANR